MTESSSEYTNLPLPLNGEEHKISPPPIIQSAVSASAENISRPKRKISQTPVIPGILSTEEARRLELLEKEFDRLDSAGSVPTSSISDEIARLRAKQSGYSLEEGIFAPGSVRMNIDPVNITEDGRPVYPWISGETGKRLREEGVIMKQPEEYKKKAKKDKRLRTHVKNAI